MMRMLFILILLLVSGWLGIQLSKDPGYVVITINQWSIETTVWFAVISIVIFFFLLYVVFRIFLKIVHFPAKWHAWRERRKTQKALNTTRKGLIEYSEGYWQKANYHLIKALPHADTPLLNYLTAARAAQKMGDNKLRDYYLSEAQQSMPEAKIAVELTQAELQLANQQWEQALATLKHLHDLAPGHHYVLKLLMDLYQQVKDWPHLINLLPELKKHKVISTSEYEHMMLLAYSESIKNLARLDDLKALENFMNQLPKSLRYQPELNHIYANTLLKHHKNEKAESILRTCLRKSFQEDLIDLYGICQHQPEPQLSFAESLLKKNPHSADLYLCLGRLSMQCKLWGKAKTYLKKSIELKPTAENHAQLGLLYEYLNEPFKASEQYKKGLEINTEFVS